MTLSTFVFAAAFIAIAGLLLWILIGARGSWKVKLALIVVIPSFGIAVWGSMDSLMGWPTSADVPGKSLLQWAVIHEPGDAGKGDPGRIHLWLVPLGKDADRDYPRGTPRAYVLPYSRELHKLVQEGMERVKKGHPVVLERTKRRARRGGGGGTLHNPTDRYRLYDLPPPEVRKDAPH